MLASLLIATVGGVLIGLASGLLLAANRRNAGISGIAAGLLWCSRDDIAWRLAFLLGLIGSPWLYSAFSEAPSLSIDSSITTLAIAGILVGFGTRLGGGCTSGHGVCGLARGSKRSLVATLTFMLSAGLVVFLVRHYP
ncbi:MAG: YeeE/YedE thiosulfate transporter family protein [Methyloprofundus sp.]|nr:YeeE/YedE thiosulfate transporter family protein [Methyloprofundus sp.]